MPIGRITLALCAPVLALLASSTPTYAARCGGDFNTFVAAMSQEAAAAEPHLLAITFRPIVRRAEGALRKAA